MKKITYQIEGYTEVYNPETEAVEKQASIATVEVLCENQAQFDDCYATAEKVAVGEIIVEGEFDPEPEPTPSGGDTAVWDELDAAYQSGYDEGYTEGVNSAYDQ